MTSVTLLINKEAKMKLDFSKCKTPEDVDKVWKKKEVVSGLKVIKRLLVLQLETSGVSPRRIKEVLKRGRGR